MSDSHSSFKRIPISQLQKFEPEFNSDSYLLVCNCENSNTTGTVNARDLISDYLDDVLTGSDNFSGLTDYISQHGGGGGGGSLPAMIHALAEKTETYSIFSDDVVVSSGVGDSSTYRVSANDFILSVLDQAQSTSGWQDYPHWLYYTFGPDGGDGSHLYKVYASEYLEYQMYSYFDDLEELDPVEYSDDLKIPIYGAVSDDELHYISLGELAEYIKNYTPPQ